MTMPSTAFLQALADSRARVAKNFPELMSPRFQRPRISESQALEAAGRLCEPLCSVPFYAKKAEKARLAGDEMAYWLGLQASEATLRRP
jgi:hypothetical protein